MALSLSLAEHDDLDIVHHFWSQFPDLLYSPKVSMPLLRK